MLLDVLATLGIRLKGAFTSNVIRPTLLASDSVNQISPLKPGATSFKPLWEVGTPNSVTCPGDPAANAGPARRATAS